MIRLAPVLLMMAAVASGAAADPACRDKGSCHEVERAVVGVRADPACRDKGSCHEVERAVVGVRAGEGFHWLRAFGIADGDGYAPDQIQVKREKGVYVLPLYSVCKIVDQHLPTLVRMISCHARFLLSRSPRYRTTYSRY